MSKIVFKTHKGAYIISINDIIFCKAQGRYTEVNTKDSSFLVSKHLKCVEKQLNSTMFFRAHNSFLINYNFVKEYCSKSNEIIMENNRVKLALNKRKTFFEKMKIM